MSIFLRKTEKETPVSGKHFKVSLPGSIDKNRFTGIFDDIAGHAGSVDILENPEDSCMTDASGPLLLIGNLADSKCVERLYYDFLSATDLWYPGPSGYEVRTLLDPYGTGFNVIHIGYSDDAGLENAIEYFKGQTGETIAFQKEIHPTRLHIPDEYADHIFNDEMDSKKDTYFYSIRPENKGYLAYLTGNETALTEYIAAIEEILEMPMHHLMFYNRYVVWRLLEVTGRLEGKALEEVPDFFLRWAKSEEGIGSIDRHQYQSPYLTRNNHGTIPALGIKMFSLYLRTYHPEINEADRFEELADNVYKPYFNGSWKPQCDGLCHGWWLSQPVLFHYGLLDPEKKYFKAEGARKAAECALAVIANDGYLPAAGDSQLNRQHPGCVLRIAAAYYKDGRYRYANDILPFQFANSGEMSAMHRQFDIGIDPVIPNSGGTTIVPVDKLIYETWEHEDENYASMVSDTPPFGPIEKCFDKISFRAGWDMEDDYLLIDGLGGGGHSYADAGAILEYTSHGVPFLVSEDRLTYVEPENHNMITISRDGLRQPITAFPLIEDVREYDDGTAYLKILSANNNGANWTRELFFIPGIGIAIRDYVEAVESGEFSIEAHFRTPGTVLPREDGYVAIRNDNKGGKIAFVLTSFDQEAAISFERKSYNHLFRTQPGKEVLGFLGLDNKALFLKRYRIKSPEITEFKAKHNKKLEKGQSVVFTHFLATSGNSQKPLEAKLTEEGLSIETGNKVKALAFFNKAPEALIDFDPEQPEFDFFADLLQEESSPIMSIDIENGLLVKGLMSGKISVGPIDGEASWEAREDEPVNTVCIKDGVIYAGIGKNGISAYRGGINLWQKKFERIPTLYYWWELETQRIVSLKAEGDLLFAGCGDNHLRCFSTEGEQLWEYYYRASVPAGFEIFDIDSDGNKEIVIYGGLLSAYSQIEIIDMDGKLKYNPNENIGAGWTSYTGALKVFEYQGDKFIVQGANRNKNFILYRFDKSAGNFEEVFSYSLAGVVSALYVNEGIIYTGTSLGFLSAYDMTGNRIWLKSMNGGIRHISGSPDELIVMESEGSMYRLTLQGEINIMSMDSMRASRILEDEKGLILVQEQGVYRISRKRETYDL